MLKYIVRGLSKEITCIDITGLIKLLLPEKQENAAN